ncbi:phosphatase PAP2 family protein [Variovorax sp. PBL-H6]|uniref:phosphatase PAP2 family protein n=1 Tax=Variovorax sp. PBL-H6 TaxID=434009 RepID=UPI0013A54B9D|nr:phosphatase PAP2 family protein [Variovorax sp. PBL-H6]
MPPFHPPHWRAELVFRMRHLLALKFIGVTVFTWLFFIGYFQLLRHPVHPMTVMPLTALDRLIPFQPEMLVAYFSLWFYVGLAPGLQRNFSELVVYGLWVGALCIAGLSLFHLWPTQVPLLMAGSSDFPGFALMQGVDAPGNACPSMHVAVAIFTAIRVDDVLRRTRSPVALRLANGLWFAAIAYSTLAVKQHVALDALAGALLGMAFAWPSMRWRPAPRASAPAAFGGADIIPHR